MITKTETATTPRGTPTAIASIFVLFGDESSVGTEEFDGRLVEVTEVKPLARPGAGEAVGEAVDEAESPISSQHLVRTQHPS